MPNHQSHLLVDVVTFELERTVTAKVPSLKGTLSRLILSDKGVASELLPHAACDEAFNYRINHLTSLRACICQRMTANHRRNDPLARYTEEANLVSMSMPTVCRRAGLPSIGLAVGDVRPMAYPGFGAICSAFSTAIRAVYTRFDGLKIDGKGDGKML